MFKSKRQQLTELYREILFRDPDESGLTAYADLDIESVRTALLNSDERKEILLSQGTGLLLDMPRDLPRSTTVNFWDTDTEELYNYNQQRLGEQWRWSQQPIIYSVNSLGYRMKEFDQIDWSNFMAVFGCSFTAGTGLPLEETWSYRIAQELKHDLVNAAIPGGGNETILLNLTRLLSSGKLPKLVIISWSSLVRKCYWYKGTVILHGSVELKNKLWESAYYNYLINPEQWAYEFLETKRQVDLLCKLAGIRVWHMTSFNEYNFVDAVDKIIPRQSDGTVYGINNWAARDYNIESKTAHPGLELQDRIVACWNQRA